VSYAHANHQQSGLPAAHGVEAMSQQLAAGSVALGPASTPGKGGYAQPDWGFWNTYLGSELQLGIIEAGSVPAPGPQCDQHAVRAGLGELLELARRETLDVTDAAAYPHLCVCAGAAAPDGAWLARLMCAVAPASSATAGAAARRDTIRLLARVMDTHHIARPSADVAASVAFGSFAVTDSVLAQIAGTPAWRGAMLRNYSVGAWRRLWSWLVDQVTGLLPVVDLADQLADELPGGTVAAFVADLPETMADGQPAPAEPGLRQLDWPLPTRELAVLAVGARRASELTGVVRDAFLGQQRGIDLAPEWMARRLADCSAMPLRDFARELCMDLLARARRVSWRKARRRADGTLWLPARLHERGELLFRTSREGAGDVGVRLDPLTTVLAGCGVLVRSDDWWVPTSTGRTLLDLPS
jgi:hypothetical protein